MGGRLKMIQKTFLQMAMARQYTPARRRLMEFDLGRVNHCLITKEKVKDWGEGEGAGDKSTKEGKR